jgi:single-strand DNA-binding protein
MINKVILIGNVGRDPELRYTASGTAVANFSLATTRRFKDRDGNQREETEWHRCVAWARLAEIINQYAPKGKQIYVEGRLQTRQWDDKDGNTRYTTEIVIEEMKLLGGRVEGGGGGGGDSSYGGSSGGYGGGGGGGETIGAPSGGAPVTDDDIPF